MTAPVVEARDALAGKDRFSSGGNWVYYYYSTRAEFGCLYAQRIDRATARPIGAPAAIAHSHSPRRSLANVFLGPLEIGVGRDKIVFNLAEETGNI